MTRIMLRRPSRADKFSLIQAHIESRDYHAPWVEPFTDAAGFDIGSLRRLQGHTSVFWLLLMTK